MNLECPPGCQTSEQVRDQDEDIQFKTLSTVMASSLMAGLISSPVFAHDPIFGIGPRVLFTELVNTSGTKWFISPGIFWTKHNFAIKAGIQILIYSNLNGTQQESDYRAKATFEWHL